MNLRVSENLDAGGVMLHLYYAGQTNLVALDRPWTAGQSVFPLLWSGAPVRVTSEQK